MSKENKLGRRVSEPFRSLEGGRVPSNSLVDGGRSGAVPLM